MDGFIILIGVTFPGVWTVVKTCHIGHVKHVPCIVSQLAIDIKDQQPEWQNKQNDKNDGWL